MTIPLAIASPSSLGLDSRQLERLSELVTRHVAEGRYPGAQFAIARHGKLGVFSTIGDARIAPTRVAASDDTLWLMYSNTKVITACAVWLLVERGALSFTDRVSDHLPGFEVHGKKDITLVQLLSHQSGFPSADVPAAAWEDHELLRKIVCGFTLEWTPGSRVQYHGRSAHWVAGAMIEALTKMDFRDFIRENVTEPLGLGDELYLGMPDAVHARAVDMHEPAADGRQVPVAEANSAAHRRAGAPNGGGYATARAMAAFYQMLLSGGRLNGVRLLSPRMIAYVTRNVTGDRVDLNYITPEIVVNASRMVRRGVNFSLSIPFDSTGPQINQPRRFNPIHRMILTGPDFTTGAFTRPGGVGFADDMVIMALQCATQWDALAHCFLDGQLYNGYDANLVGSLGAKKNGIEKMARHIVTRGVLLDIPRVKGVPWLEPGYGITAQDLDAAVAAHKVKVGAGDALLVRTGQIAMCRQHGGWGDYAGGDAPGLSFHTAGWVHERQLAAVATDTWGMEVRPNEIPNTYQPLHQVFIPSMGLLVGEIFDLEALAEDCATDGVYEFMFVAPPIPITGAVGSPVNPFAIK